MTMFQQHQFAYTIAGRRRLQVGQGRGMADGSLPGMYCCCCGLTIAEILQWPMVICSDRPRLVSLRADGRGVETIMYPPAAV